MNNERKILAQIYSAKFVARMSDAQVFAVFKRLQSSGKIKL